jgi:hypothetical protein
MQRAFWLIGTPATEKGVVVPVKASVVAGVVSPKACCQPTRPEAVSAAPSPRLNSWEMRAPSTE